jgi:hypothetical protein
MSPRLNNTPEVSTPKFYDETSNNGCKLEVWYGFEAKLEDKLSYHVAYATI